MYDRGLCAQLVERSAGGATVEAARRARELLPAAERVLDERCCAPHDDRRVVRDLLESRPGELVVWLDPGVIWRQAVARHVLEADLARPAAGHHRVPALPGVGGVEDAPAGEPAVNRGEDRGDSRVAGPGDGGPQGD